MDKKEIDEMQKAINCLAIELHPDVWEDVNKRWVAVLKLLKETKPEPYNYGIESLHD